MREGKFTEGATVLTRNHRQEALCRAYVQAIVAHAGLNYSLPAYDYGIDMSFRLIQIQLSRRLDIGTELDIQLKSTTRALIQTDTIVYDLERHTYDDLRIPMKNRQRVLVLFLLPEEEGEWLHHSEEALAIRRCAYWLSLRGMPPVTRKKTVRVHIPRANVFSTAGLLAIMNRLQRGEVL